MQANGIRADFSVIREGSTLLERLLNQKNDVRGLVT